MADELKPEIAGEATPPARRNLLDSWQLTREELTEIVAENPSMRGLMFGFVAEYKLRKLWLLRPEIENLVRPRSHDRKQKYDFGFNYRGQNIRLEVKCLDTPSVKASNAGYTGTFQCNASDARAVTLPSGHQLTTNCLVVGGFDLLAVCVFSFGNEWKFAFALNHELPRTTWRKYEAEHRQYLLKSTMHISWPPIAPFAAEPFGLLDRFVAERVGR